MAGPSFLLHLVSFPIYFKLSIYIKFSIIFNIPSLVYLNFETK